MPRNHRLATSEDDENTDHVHRKQGRLVEWGGSHRSRDILEVGALAHLRPKTFRRLHGGGFKANYYDVETGEYYWISGPRKDGRDRLYDQSSKPVEVDEDVAAEYWSEIRGVPAPAPRRKTR